MSRLFMIEKRMEIAGAHHLKLNYESKCKNQQGHNWVITVYCKSKELDENEMVYDFGKIKGLVHEIMDHKNLNEVFDFNPTAEKIADWVLDTVPYCWKVKVQESKGNIVTVISE